MAYVEPKVRNLKNNSTISDEENDKGLHPQLGWDWEVDIGKRWTVDKVSILGGRLPTLLRSGDGHLDDDQIGWYANQPRT